MSTPIISPETAAGIARCLPNHDHIVDCAFCAAVGSDLVALVTENRAMANVIVGLVADVKSLRTRCDDLRDELARVMAERDDLLAEKGIVHHGSDAT